MKTHGVAVSPCANGRGGKAAPVGATATLQKSRQGRRSSQAAPGRGTVTLHSGEHPLILDTLRAIVAAWIKYNNKWIKYNNRWSSHSVCAPSRAVPGARTLASKQCCKFITQT